MDIVPIETPRLLLRQFAVEDAEDVFAIFSDEATMPLMRWMRNMAA